MKVTDRRRRTILIFSLLALICFTLALGLAPLRFFNLAPLAASAQQGRGARPVRSGISETAMRQIQSLIAAKRARTGVERKISSQLLFASRMRRGQMITPEVRTLEVAAEVSDDGMTVVDLTASVSSRLMDRITQLGGQVLAAYPQAESIRARLPIDSLTEIASFSEVRFIQPKQIAFTSSGRSNARYDGGQRFERAERPALSERTARVREYLGTALSRLSASAPAAAAQFELAEGDITHRANEARRTFGVNGSGVRIGVLSDGAVNLRQSQARGALGPVTILPGQIGDGDEGTAMLEIIHQLAPGAELFFATAFNSVPSFAENIRALRRAGCDIIVDDVFWVTESPFQDGQAPGVISSTGGGLIAQAVNEVTASGALYFSSAGNSGNLANNTSGVWEGPFKPGANAAPPLPIDAGIIHDFGDGQLSNLVTVGTSFPVTLSWSDPLGGSANDYDLYALNITGTALLAASVDAQFGSQDPFEILPAQAGGRRLVIALFEGEERFLHLNTNRGRLAIATNGQTRGHSAGAEAISVAATPAFFPFGPAPNPTGPFPNPFTGTSRVELFTSDGPRRLFFDAEGRPLAPEGILRQKPDGTAADGTSVTGVGFFPTTFYGTSAAAPHAAAIAALIKSANPSLSAAQIRQTLIDTAIDIERPGVDELSGAGIFMPINAAQALGLNPMASLDLGSIDVEEISGNGNGVVEPGERARVTVQVINSGVVNAFDVSAKLLALVPEVFVQQPEAADYGDIAAGGGSAQRSFEFTLSSVSSCDLRAAFSLSLDYSGGPSPKSLNFELRTGPPAIEINSVLDGAAPASGANFSAETGMQIGRATRTVVATACERSTPFPGLFSTTPRRYDAYTFSSCPTSAPACVTLSLSTPCIGSREIFAMVYLDSFDPNNIAQNYIGDLGDSPLEGETLNLSFYLPRGRRFVVVVHEINTGGSTGCEYKLTVSGLCQSCETSNLVCVQDDSSNDSLLFNFLTGDYLFTRCADGRTATGRGRVGRNMGAVTLDDGPRLSAVVEKQAGGPTNRGSARVRPGGVGPLFVINDRNILNNTCSCR